MNIAIDIDEVLADFQTAFLTFYNKRHHTSFSVNDIVTYSYADVFGVSFEIIVKEMYEFFETREFTKLLPAKGSISAINTLSQSHKLFVITSRPHHIESITRTWLQEHYGNNIHQLVHTNQFAIVKSEITKTQVCLKNNIKIIIEDAPPYIIDATQNNIFSIVFDKPWNRNLTPNSLIHRVTSWDEAVSAIKRRNGS